jgi:hypothetical protein
MDALNAAADVVADLVLDFLSVTEHGCTFQPFGLG